MRGSRHVATARGNIRRSMNRLIMSVYACAAILFTEASSSLTSFVTDVAG